MSAQLWIAVLALLGPLAGAGDPREAYDVLAYRLDLRVEPAERRLSGTVGIEARVLAERLEALELDLASELEVESVALLSAPLLGDAPPRLQGSGAPLRFQHRGDRLVCALPAPLARADTLAVAVTYAGSPGARNSFDGFHWRTTESGEPWIGTSCQTLGAHTWWPCKASYFHPEDKPERLFVNASVPAGLYAVSNGRLTARERAAEGWETFRWRHDYPLETYAVTLNVAPYVVLEDELVLDGLAAPLPLRYYVLPEREEAARVQFADVPRLLAEFTRAFGPFPFPESKFGLVHTSFWGMEHSTAIAYGSSFPAWRAQRGLEDPFAARNRWYDYILVHEVAHEWWGNSVSAADWADFWLHEGFATYAEGVYVEGLRGREDADRWFAELRRAVPRRGGLTAEPGANAREAYGPILYAKGALVLSTLRHLLDDDEAWWSALRAFQRDFRHGNATTDDFRAAVERASGRPLAGFFDSWVRGSGYPIVTGSARVDGAGILLELESRGTDGTQFEVPLDLAWREAGRERARRVVVAPGAQRIEIPCATQPEDLALRHTERVLARWKVQVE